LRRSFQSVDPRGIERTRPDRTVRRQRM
jgi:hypothetical protein